MMRLSHYFLLFFVFFFKGCSTSSSHELSYCHDEECSALLQFKQSFTIDATASCLEGAYPKVLSWKPYRQGGNKTSCCCTWDGVECESDEQTGHVIGLDLQSSCLYGSINSNSSLFRLVHLQMLNLADNNFNYSPIPTSIGSFQRLTHLDLSYSRFSGRVPSDVSQLVKLSVLDLSYNIQPSSGVDPQDRVALLQLGGSDFRSIVQNLTSLEHLIFRYINISSTIPYSVANLSFLRTLDLHQCGLFGNFPGAIFHLQNFRSLYLRNNHNLIGYLPEFNQSSGLVTLDLQATKFSGNFPASIGKIESLKQLDVAACNFSTGLIPPSLGNLRQLTYLDISLLFRGPIPESFANLTQLTVFRIASSGLTGQIPSWLSNFSELVYLDFAYNRLHGSIPTSFSNLTSLQILNLESNELSGIVEFQMIQKLQKLTQLHLGTNKLEFVSGSTAMNATINVPQFIFLNLDSCSLRELPYFLRYQKHLEQLFLVGNKMYGQVPKWMWNMSTESLIQLDISDNFLSGQLPISIPWVNLQILSLDSNMFHGPLPIPALSTLVYDAHDNKFTGKISPLICNMSFLSALDLSSNNLSGMIPQCFGNLSDHLELLLLGNNSFHGTLPQTYTNKSNLRMLDVSRNQLQGQLPRSLMNCLMLQVLILSNNYFIDVFPSWLSVLPELKLLSMRHNGFSRVIGKPAENTQQFPKLRILDISHNNFSGRFVAESIFSKYAMRSNITINQGTYMKAVVSYVSASGTNRWLTYDSSITMTIKGVERHYPKVQEALAVIDISSNKFEGNIDESIGSLIGIWSLNFSNNFLSGSIPSSFGNLTNLESLDLSNNKLSGEIPRQLAQLTFLAELNVSHNNLTGPIPHGPQFSTFNTTSYEGNPGLCGDPLPNRCRSSDISAQLPHSSIEENDSAGSDIDLDWIFVLAGCVSGFVVGVVLADIGITRRRGLFLGMVGILIRLMERIRRLMRFAR